MRNPRMRFGTTAVVAWAYLALLDSLLMAAVTGLVYALVLAPMYKVTGINICAIGLVFGFAHMGIDRLLSFGHRPAEVEQAPVGG